MKKLVWIAGGVAMVVALVFVVRWQNGAPVEAARVRTGQIREFVDEQAKTRLPKTHLITMPYNGRIASIELAEGTPVKAGQVVAQVVPLDPELSVKEATAAVERLEASIRENDDVTVESTGLQQTIKFVESMDRTVEAATERVRAGLAKLEYANDNLKRIRTLAETRAATEEQLSQARVAQVEASVDYQQDLLVLSAMQSLQAATALGPTLVRQYIARKSLASAVLEKEKVQAEAKLGQQLRDQRRSVMTSPIDGIVLSREESNERQVSAGTVLLSIGRLEDLEVEADVLSQDVVNVKLGNPVEIYGPAIGPQPAAGAVDRIYPAGFTKISSLGVEQQRVKVVVRLAEGELARLRSQRELGVGYQVRVRIFTAAKERASIVPRSALFRGPSGDWQVYAIRSGAARLQSVAVGLMNDEAVEIVQGLDAADVVVLSPDATLVDGARVRAVLP